MALHGHYFPVSKSDQQVSGEETGCCTVTVHENSNRAKFVSVIDNYVASDMAKLINHTVPPPPQNGN